MMIIVAPGVSKIRKIVHRLACALQLAMELGPGARADTSTVVWLYHQLSDLSRKSREVYVSDTIIFCHHSSYSFPTCISQS